jgi:hypothetical protein
LAEQQCGHGILHLLSSEGLLYPNPPPDGKLARNLTEPLRRVMIDDTLDGAKSSRYKHATRHLLECQSLAMMIRDYGTLETDEAFTSRLRASHARKTGFWKQVAEVSGTRP